ncbi:MAG: hypothetical protein Q4B72_11005 [Lachnospiraceae bacterium]|nr:hypothetical protein [Lachnospiraceae bacterium]
MREGFLKAEEWKKLKSLSEISERRPPEAVYLLLVEKSFSWYNT